MKRLLLRGLFLLTLLLCACGNAQQSGQGGTSAAVQPSPVTAPSLAATAVPLTTAMPSDATQPAVVTVQAPSPTTEVTAGPDQFINPVIDQDFPDPDILKVGDTYYAYATNAGSYNIQMAQSTDLVNWQLLGDPLPQLPAWARKGFTWAPEVTTSADGNTYIMYFTARDDASDKQCIGAATSDKPEGPFEGAGDKAFICQADIGGSIDASSFVDDDGKRYVLWKNDGNCCNALVHLYLQEVSDDGLTLEGQPAQLITNDQWWEGRLVEAPTLWKHEGKYHLFYSANHYAGADYTTGYAVADAATGPYTKQEKPFMATDFENGATIGPGGQDIVIDKEGETWIAFHSWNPTNTYRAMMLEDLAWENGRPVVRGPDAGPQPKP